ncbi:MAG: SusC/RagA family TonB-linked outer membrane protein [Bacteroidales bacterium]
MKCKFNLARVTLALVFTLTSALATYAQTKTVSGRVTDSNRQPLPGVTVVEKGSTNGTITDVDGKYTLVVSSEAKSLTFSFVGMKTEELAIAGKKSLNIALKEDAIGLDEVVAVGYGTVKKSDLTGSVSSIESDIISKVATPDAAGALQGRVAGVNIQRAVGAPGEGFSIQVRGLSSINNSNSPLYVIDGIPTSSGLGDINPEDIEAIDVLKDASATAIYGSRGANGVVIVTTKRGKAGKMSIQYNGYYGFRYVSNLPDMMSGEEYVQWRTDLFENTGKSTERSNADFFTEDEWKIIDNKDYTDWVDLILRKGVQTSNTISASGGSENGTFAISIGQLKEEGTIPGQDYNRYNMRLNLTQKFKEIWEVGGSLYFTQSIQNRGSYETLRSAYRLPGVANPYDENGDPTFRVYRNDGVTNPMFEYREDGETRENRKYRAFGNIYLQVEPIKGLTIRSQLSPQMSYLRSGLYQGQYSKNGQGSMKNTKASYDTSDYFGYVMDNMISYTKDIGNHAISANFVQSMQKDQWETAYQEANSLPYNSKWYNLDSAPLSSITASKTGYTKATLASFLGRVQYSYAGKYLFTFTGRYDGSSRLAAGNKWAFFPSGAFAWRVIEEDFMKNASAVSNLKLRLSYGVTGNDAVSIYGTQSNVAMHNYDFGGTASSAYYKSGLSNYDLTWEKTNEINIGVDYGFFASKINGSVDVYRRDAKDLIMKRQLPQTSGWSEIWDNVGWVRNQGIEIALNTVNIEKGDFSWTTSIIFDTNRNEIMELYGGKEDDIANKWFIGKAIKSNYDYVFDGVWQLGEEKKAAKYGQTPGQIKVKDLNNDGAIDATNDKAIIGQRTPKWNGSITNTFNYRGFDFSFYVYTSQGMQMQGKDVQSFQTLQGNFNSMDIAYWTPENPTNKFGQPGNTGRYFSQSLYRDVSFLRVGNISLGYSIPKHILKRLNLKQLRVYATMNNPLTFTDYEGFDPEWAGRNTWGTTTGFSTFLMGINLEL